MTTNTKTIYELVQEVRKHPDFMFGTIFTFDDLNYLDGRQTTPEFDPDKAEAAMLESGLAYLVKTTRPGCDCVSHDENDECVEVEA